MLLMTKYSNEVSFLDLVTILTTLNNLKCRRFFLGHPLLLCLFRGQVLDSYLLNLFLLESFLGVQEFD